MLLLLLPGGAAGAQVDAAGERALAVLRQLGLPPALALTVGPPAAGLKQRAAAKKRAAAALDAQARARALLLGSCGQGRSAPRLCIPPCGACRPARACHARSGPEGLRTEERAGRRGLL